MAVQYKTDPKRRAKLDSEKLGNWTDDELLKECVHLGVTTVARLASTKPIKARSSISVHIRFLHELRSRGHQVTAELDQLHALARDHQREWDLTANDVPTPPVP